MRIAVAGAGFTGAVIANMLATAGHNVVVFETRSHVAGNCYTVRDHATGVLLHAYGPHIFHTNNRFIWQYVKQYAEFLPLVYKSKAIAGGRVYSFPINLHTINQFFDENWSPDEARRVLQVNRKAKEDRLTFEDEAIELMGPQLYEAFFRVYTRKQWGRDPHELPASIIKRLPVRFTYDDRYYNDDFVGIPMEGYTPIVQQLLNHRNINLCLAMRMRPEEVNEYDHTFWTGPLDAFFDYKFGMLPYRTITFANETHEGDYQGNTVMNYCDGNVPWTRITEHKHFAPWEFHKKTVITKEYSREAVLGDDLHYPVRLPANQQQVARYEIAASVVPNVTFAGRLGKFKYLDMHNAIDEAMHIGYQFLHGAKK